SACASMGLATSAALARSRQHENKETVNMRKIRSTVLLGFLGALGALAASASNVEAGIVPGSTIGEVELNAGPGVDPFGGNGDCFLPNLTMGRGELLSTGGISGRRISAYLFNSGGAGAP